MLAYLDTPSGISGDMFLGCLVAAGWSIDALRESVHSLNWPEDFDHNAWSVDEHLVMKGAIQATRVEVRAAEAGQPHRHLSDIRALIEGSALAEAVIADVLAVFERLAVAEAAVHGSTPEDIHFHEVGALDSIIDIVGVCAGMHALGIDSLHAGPLPVGPGFVRSQHGSLPLPAPATLELLTVGQAPIQAAPGPGELVTPTGAALLLHFVGDRWHIPRMRLQKVAVGAGYKEFAWPNVARLWLGEPYSPTRRDTDASYPAVQDHGEPVEGWQPEQEELASGHSHASRMSLLETNIDDMNPELYGAISERLFALGARDVWLTPIQMKKSRPGIMLSVLTREEDEVSIAHALLQESTTLGMRVSHVGRYEAERRFEQVMTPYGTVPVKLKLMRGEVIAAVPEYEVCREKAREHDVATRLVYEAASALAWQRFLGPEASEARFEHKGASDG